MPVQRHAQVQPVPRPAVDWEAVARSVLLSRALDHLEESRLYPERRMFFQFVARGHDVTQALMARELTGARDAAAVYYRRRLAMGLGLGLEDAMATALLRAGSISAGRDGGVVFNVPRRDGPCVLPSVGGVGCQYTPAVGWAQSLVYRANVLGDAAARGSIALVHGGDGSTASNGFWSALNIATTLRLPLLFFIQDNGIGISVPSRLQTPDGNIAANLAAFRGLRLIDGGDAAPLEAAGLIHEAVAHVRSWAGPALLRLRVPRLSGHSGQDTQAYRAPEEIAAEERRDPLPRLRAQLVPGLLREARWRELEQAAEREVLETLARVERRPPPDGAGVARHVFAERGADGRIELPLQGGQWADGAPALPENATPATEGPRLNMLTAIRRTLEHELAVNPRVSVFGEDVARKGGVHGATLGLAERFGEARVFDTSLNEEGIIGRAVGMAYAGLVPVPEIQFRKYADPATEQLNDCGMVRWRSANRFAAPIVVRMAGGFGKCGDPWHCQVNETQFVHAPGWRLAVPATAADAVGLLRAALRGHDPTVFFEHRTLLDAPSARSPWPGDDYVLPFGQARQVRAGNAATIVSWGAMVERCEQAVNETGVDAEILDLRTLVPWDRAAVLASVCRTGRCLIVHEDNMTGGFGAEVAAVLAREAFYSLDAPIERLAMPDIPSPHAPELLQAAVPDAARIGAALRALVEG
ncbi:MAG: transketolase C-terminal domain-containing protein [Steroidobacteraceae bacterium]